jgi:hypothetical protein
MESETAHANDANAESVAAHRRPNASDRNATLARRYEREKVLNLGVGRELLLRDDGGLTDVQIRLEEDAVQPAERLA